MQGLPPKLNIFLQQINTEALHDIQVNAQLKLSQTAEYLQLPSWEEYRSSVIAATHAVSEAVVSSSHLFYISFRPVFILLSWMTGRFARFFSILLKEAVIRCQIYVTRAIGKNFVGQHQFISHI